MSIAPEHIDQWIARYLAGEASPDQIAALEAWCEQSDDNRAYVEEMRLIFRRAALPDEDQFDTDRAWERFRLRILRDRRQKIAAEDSGFRIFLRIAAGITILLVAGIFTYRQFADGSGSTIEFLSGNQVMSDTLPDGTRVFLNRQTRIQFTTDKDKKLHTAKLEGEAYFDISHADGNTFIVEAGGALIRDIGTSFNVTAYPGSSMIEVVVDEGKVLFYTSLNPGIHVKAGGKGIFHKSAQAFTVGAPEANTTAYMTHSFSFSNDPLTTVVKALNEVYTVRFDVAENVGGCRITVSFDDEEPEEIANIIAETIGLTLTRSKDTLRLEGPGCGNLLP